MQSDVNEAGAQEFRVAASGHACGILYPQSATSQDDPNKGVTNTNGLFPNPDTKPLGLPKTITLSKFPSLEVESGGISAASLNPSWSGFIHNNPHLTASQICELKMGWPNNLPAWFLNPKPKEASIAAPPSIQESNGSRRYPSASLKILDHLDGSIRQSVETASDDSMSLTAYDLNVNFKFPTRFSSDDAARDCNPQHISRDGIDLHRPIAPLGYHQKGFSGTDDADWETEANSQAPSRWNPGLQTYITSDSLADNSDSNGKSDSSSIRTQELPLPQPPPVVAYQHPSPLISHPNPFSSSPPPLGSRNGHGDALPESSVQARVMEFEKKGEFTTYRFPKEVRQKKTPDLKVKTPSYRLFPRDLSNSSFNQGNGNETNWTMNDDTSYDAATDMGTHNKSRLSLDEADGMMGNDAIRPSMDIADLPMVVERHVHITKPSSATWLSTVDEVSDEARTSSVFGSILSVTVPRSSRIGSTGYNRYTPSYHLDIASPISPMHARSPIGTIHSNLESYDISLNSMNVNASSTYVVERGRTPSRNHTAIQIHDIFNDPESNGDDDAGSFDASPIVFSGHPIRQQSPRQRMQYHRQTSEGSIYPQDPETPSPHVHAPSLRFTFEEGYEEPDTPTSRLARMKDLAGGCTHHLVRGYKACRNASTHHSRDEDIRLRLELREREIIGRQVGITRRDFTDQFGTPHLRPTRYARPFDHEAHRLYISTIILLMSLCVPPSAIIVGHGYADVMMTRLSSGDYNRLSRRVEVVGLYLGYGQVVAALGGLLFWLGFRIAG